MTILLLADNIGGGGKERRMIELIKSLCKDPSFKVVLVYIQDKGVGYDYIYDYPFTIIETDRNFKYSIKPFFVIRNAIRRYKPDIVHSWGSMCSFFLLPLLPFRKFRFINGTIADAPKHLPWYHKNYLRSRFTYLMSDMILSNSLAGIRAYSAPYHKTYCIYNGIDMQRFSNLPAPSGIKAELGISHFRFIAGMVGAFHDRKDYHTFVKAGIQLASEYNDTCFLLLGDGYNRPGIEAMVPPELKNRILFLGRRNDVEAVVQVFNVGVLTTNLDVHGEGVSNSIIEYMSLSKPVIATEGGGTNEVVEDNHNGFLIRNKDAAQLYEKLLLLYQQPALAEAMGREALETIRKKFMLDRMTSEFINVYKGGKPVYHL